MKRIKIIALFIVVVLSLSCHTSELLLETPTPKYAVLVTPTRVSVLPSPLPTATPTAKTVGVGTPLSADNWEYTVTKVEKTKTLVWSEYGNKSTAQGIFVVTYLTLKNIGKRNFSINIWDFELHDDAEVKYDPSSEGLSFVRYRKLTPLGDQFVPALSANTALVFDVNPNAKGLKLYLEQAKASIDLGQ